MSGSVKFGCEAEGGDEVPACGCASGTARDAVADADLRIEWKSAQERPPPGRIVRVRGGRVRVGTDASPLPGDGEGPARHVKVKPFAIDPYAVTNAWFAEFVAAAGYRTDAERFGWSLVFRKFVDDDGGVSDLSGQSPWWRRIDGACWKHPEGPRSDVNERADHPVVHVSWRDASAFAAWAGGRLPTEIEWECAAQGNRTGARFPWGNQEPDDQTFLPCNIWQGEFPNQNSGADGYVGTAPVNAFDPNDFGLHNMVGNTWEWCADPFRIQSLAHAAKRRNDAAKLADEKLLKGGSHLCHRSYCYRYRIAARTGVSADTSTGHVGFRLVFDA